MNEEQATVSKYVQSIHVMSKAVGILESVRLNCYNNNDMASVLLIEKAIKSMNDNLGVKTELINLNDCKKEPVKNFTQEKQIEEKQEIVQQTVAEKPKSKLFKTIKLFKNKKDNSKQVANSLLEAEKEQEIRKNENKEVDMYGVIHDKQAKTCEYSFKNSTSLSYMRYDKWTKELTMTFLRNGRTYLYSKVPYNEFETLCLLDFYKRKPTEKGAGSHFQTDFVPKYKKYKEITDTMLIG